MSATFLEGNPRASARFPYLESDGVSFALLADQVMAGKTLGAAWPPRGGARQQLLRQSPVLPFVKFPKEDTESRSE